MVLHVTGTVAVEAESGVTVELNQSTLLKSEPTEEPGAAAVFCETGIWRTEVI